MIDLLMLLSLDTSKAERLHLQILIWPMAMTISFAALPFIQSIHPHSAH